MSMLIRDKDKLKYNHNFIVKELQNVNHILLYLSGTVLTKFEVDKLYGIRNPEERTKRLLNILPTKNQLAYQHFRYALHERYPHIVKKLDATPVIQHPKDDSTNDNKKILVRRNSLILSLKPDEVISDLAAEGILTTEDCTRLKGHRTCEDKSRALVDMLPYRGPRAFRQFTLCVSKNQPQLATLLETADIDTDELRNSTIL